MEKLADCQHDAYIYSSLEKAREIRVFSFDQSSPKRGMMDFLKCKLFGRKRPLSYVGRLDSVQLEDAHRQPYVTLSYTWDSFFVPELAPPANKRSPPPTILCEGKRIITGETVYELLGVMKRFKSKHSLWIDGLCIDQKNSNELSKQVELMGEVYSSANEVIAWLGPHDSASRIAIRVIKRIYRAFGRIPRDQRPPDRDYKFNDPALFSMVKTKQITEKEWQAIVDFFSRTWFQRIWVTQEIALSSNLRFICGNSVFPMEVLVGFAKWICDMNWDHELHFMRRDTAHHPLSGFENLYYTAKLIYKMETGLDNPGTVVTLRNLFDASTEGQLCVGFIALMLIQNQHKCATNPRDKVYAPLGLAKTVVMQNEDLPHGLPVVDYNKKVDCIYREITTYIILNLENLSFLSFVDRSALELPGLPSWTPDFSRASSTKAISELPHNATHLWDLSIGGPTFISNQLRVQGIFSDEIAEIKLFQDPNTNLAPIFDLISRLNHTNLTETDNVEILFRTLVQNLFEKHWEATPYGEPDLVPISYVEAVHSFNQWLKIRIAEQIDSITPPRWKAIDIPPIILSAYSSSPLLPKPADLESFITDFRRYHRAPTPRLDKAYDDQKLFILMKSGYADERGVFRTRDGRLGLGPCVAQMGDQVCFLHGAKVPFVLRELESGNWEVIGEAYVHGFMQGEAFKEGAFHLENAVEIVLE